MYSTVKLGLRQHVGFLQIQSHNLLYGTIWIYLTLSRSIYAIFLLITDPMFLFPKISHVFCKIAIYFLPYFYDNTNIKVSKINQLNNLLIITDTDIAEIWPINRFTFIYRLIGASLTDHDSIYH